MWARWNDNILCDKLENARVEIFRGHTVIYIENLGLLGNTIEKIQYFKTIAYSLNKFGFLGPWYLHRSLRVRHFYISIPAMNVTLSLFISSITTAAPTSSSL